MPTVSASASTSGATPGRGLVGFGAVLHRFGVRRDRARARRREITRITRELRTCTERELGELGLSRADIPGVARGTSRAG